MSGDTGISKLFPEANFMPLMRIVEDSEEYVTSNEVSSLSSQATITARLKFGCAIFLNRTA